MPSAHVQRAARGAYLHLAGQNVALAEVLHLDPSTVSRRRSEAGPLAKVLGEVDALERDGIDTTPMLVALVTVQAEARAARAEDALSLPALAVEEQRADSEQDVARARFLAGEPEGLRIYCDGLDREVAVKLRTRLVLARAAGER